MGGSFRITPAGLGLGGTVSGNLVITGTLNVQGNVTFDVLQTTTGLFSAEGGILIDETGTEVLLVRAEADAGDVFAVNTTTPGVIITGTLSTSGILSANGGMIVDGDGAALFVVRQADDTNVFVVDTVTPGAALTGTLAVSGATTLQGITIIDADGTETFLIRKNSDGGDIFAVDPDNAVVAITGSLTISTPLAVAQGGIGIGTLADGGILLGSGTSALTAMTRGTAGQTLIGSTSGDPVMGTISGTANEITVTTGDGTLALSIPDAVTLVTLTLTNDLIVANGGTGAGTFTDGGILLGSGTGALSVLGRGTAGQILIGSTSGDPVMGSLTGVANETAVALGDGTVAVGLATNITVAGTLGVTGNTDLQGTLIIDITNGAALRVRKNADAGDVLAVDTTNSRILIGTLVATDQTFEGPPEKVNVVEGNIEVFDTGTLGAEIITDGDMSATTNWAGAGDWSDTIGGTTTYTHSAGSGSLTQTATQRVTNNEGSNARWYKVVYTLTSVTNAGAMVLTITNAFAAAAVTLPVTANGTFTVIFQSHASTADTADYVMAVAGSAGSDAFTMDDLSVKEVLGGNIILGGKLTGGGSDGLAVSGGGTVSTFEKDLGTVGSTETIDWRDGNHQKLTLDENLTITFIDPDGPASLVVHFVQDGSGTNTVAWPSDVDWEGGTAPTITSASSSIDIITLYFDGSRYFGGFLQNFS